MSVEKLRPSFAFDQDRLERLKKIVPEAFTDGKINWETLRESLDEYVEDERNDMEHFGLSWPGKRIARRRASELSQGTLVPRPGEGVNEDTTHNVFIESDNLDALKLVLKAYMGRVKFIYIDPPYNTGNDFIYRDDLRENEQDYLIRTGQMNEQGKYLTTNTRTDGRFHSNWLSMMLPRLMLTRQLLSENGILMVSISDGEHHHLRMLLNEVFGEHNFLATFIWVNEGNIDNQSRFKRNHEYILVYARDEQQIDSPVVIDPNIPQTSKLFRDFIENTIVKNGPGNPVSGILLQIGFPSNFEAGVIEPQKNFWPQLSEKVHIENYKTVNLVMVSSGWSSKTIFKQFIESGFQPVKDTKDQETVFFFTETGAISSRKQRTNSQSHVLTVLNNMGTVQAESSKLADLGITFTYPKPATLLEYLEPVMHFGFPGSERLMTD